MFEIVFVILILLFRHARKRARRRRLNDQVDSWAAGAGMLRVGHDLFGERDGIAVGARFAFDIRHGERSITPQCTLHARVQPPLDLGLGVSPRRREIEVPGAGKAHVAIDGGAFDRRFDVRADEPERARQLLGTALCRALMERLHPSANFLVSDQGIALQAPIDVVNAQWLAVGVNTLASVARAMERSRGDVTVARTLRPLHQPWRQYAHRQALKLTTAPLGLAGHVGEAEARAYAVRTGPFAYQLEVWVRFEEPLGLGLLMQPMRTVDRMKEMFVGEDTLLGDDVFDETFLVRTSDEEGVRALLDDSLRALLLKVHHDLGALSVTDDGLQCRRPKMPDDPSVVPNTVVTLLELAHAVSGRRNQARGPYR